MNDRGTIKWTSLMMPEQTQLLNEMWEQQDWKEKPDLDGQYIAEINLKIEMALENDLTIEIEYFKNHDYHKIKGKLLGVDVLNQFVQIEDEYLPLDSITGAWID
ncbi:YolD-like family protein [Virgibacillus sp. NKC19-16]|uniref:YolD-like family protein n=1 Tax=Virgibacillus salidurans TaxID=2831673 RepID=UPI001F1B6D7F|nr:YolD-like family protein [Virgibacillus sp. NKC19-16]UJL47141.1 YolD-like family protein [Virgibacillus sp. NKC19-16]